MLRRLETPEAVIIEVKDVVRDGIGAMPRPPLIEERQLIDSMVGWAIEDDFAAD